MTITAPINVEPQHDDIQVLDDDLHIVEEAVTDSSLRVTTAAPVREPLVPFLILGCINLIAILTAAILLAF